MSELVLALLRLQRTAPEYGPGMVCEALLALGHEALIPAWLERGLPRPPPLRPGRPLAPEERAPALGDAGRVSDWIASYEDELARRPWREVLAEAALRLAPGLFGGAARLDALAPLPGPAPPRSATAQRVASTTTP